MEKKFKKVAFILAVFLITLGIIGVVASMTLPTLVAKYQKQVTVTKLKKIYSVMNQAYNHAQADYGDYTTWDTPTNYDEALAYNDKYWAPYIKYVKTCTFSV